MNFLLQILAIYFFEIECRKDGPDFESQRSIVFGQSGQELECAIGCPKNCAPLCKPSCCFPQYFNVPSSDLIPGKHFSPGHSAAGKCSPTCALFWTQEILDSANGALQHLPCPVMCLESSCCQPTPEYASLASSCSSQCAPTYEESCCHSSQLPQSPMIEQLTQLPNIPQPSRVERPAISYMPCSAFCAPKFTAECCAKSTVLAPIRI